MKKTVALLLAVVFCSCFRLAGKAEAALGPMAPMGQPGDISFAVGYERFNNEWEPSEATWENARVEQNRYFLRLGYVFSDVWQGHLEIGGADLEAKIGPGPSFSDGIGGYLGLGMSGRFHSTHDMAIGPFFNGTIAQGYEATVGGENIEVKTPFSLAAGALILAGTEFFAIYGGPALFFDGADVKNINTGESSTYREENNFGGFLGVHVPVGSFRLGIEGRYQGRASMSFSFGKTF